MFSTQTSHWAGRSRPRRAAACGHAAGLGKNCFCFSLVFLIKLREPAVMHHCISAEHIKAGPREGTDTPFEQALMTSSVQVTGHV